MAEAVGLASGLLTLAICALNASVTLHSTIESFRSHNQRVVDLQQELEALATVLGSLSETIESSRIDLSSLDLPLLRCGSACTEFEQELLKCSSRSTGSRTSFRDWAKLKYLGDDIDGFKRLLAGYKMTINIALTQASLRESAQTAESLENYQNLIEVAQENLDDRLQSIDEKLSAIIGETLTESTTSARDVTAIKEERSSALRCLQICELLSQQIEQLQITAAKEEDSTGAVKPEVSSQSITREGLEACRDNLTLTAVRLGKHMKELTARIVYQSKMAMTSKDDIADLERLHEQWEAARQCIEFCSTADKHFKNNVSNVENYGTGDSVQFMVSTNGQVIHGKNRGLGWRNRQVGGHMSDAAVLQLSKDMVAINLQKREVDPLHSRSDPAAMSDTSTGRSPVTDFKNRYGEGFKLDTQAPRQSTSSTPSLRSTRDGSRNP